MSVVILEDYWLSCLLWLCFWTAVDNNCGVIINLVAYSFTVFKTCSLNLTASLANWLNS